MEEKAIFWKDDSGRMPERKIKKDYVKENVDYIYIHKCSGDSTNENAR